MPRKPLEKVSNLPYHIYNRVLSQKKYPPELMERIWGIYCDELRVLSWAFHARIHLFVLMHNHFHIILETPEANIDEVMMHFQREVSKRIKEITGTQDFRFQARYKWVLITNAIHYENVYRYVAMNPVEAGICGDPALYRFSTLHGQFGNSTLHCPIFELSPFAGILPACMAARHEWIRCRV